MAKLRDLARRPVVLRFILLFAVVCYGVFYLSRFAAEATKGDDLWLIIRFVVAFIAFLAVFFAIWHELRVAGRAPGSLQQGRPDDVMTPQEWIDHWDGLTASQRRELAGKVALWQAASRRCLVTEQHEFKRPLHKYDKQTEV